MTKQKSFSLFLFLTLLFSAAHVHAQARPGIYTPGNGVTLRGIITITGTAVADNFQRYELAFLQEANTGAGWIPFISGDTPVTNGSLGVWDTTLGESLGASVYPDGVYQLRLRIVRTDSNVDEYFINGLQIANGQTAQPQAQPPTAVSEPDAVPTSIAPTADPAGAASPPPITATITVTPTLIPTPTAIPTRPIPTPLPTSADAEPQPQPDVLPSLTPFPTPVPQATPDESGFVSGEADPAEPQPLSFDTALDSALNFDFGVIGRGFRQGVLLVFMLFAIMAAYLVGRAIVRWVWQMISTNF